MDFFLDYKNYISEREGGHVLADEYGFATYTFPSPTSIYLQDIYIKPVHRMSSRATTFANLVADIGREKGCSAMFGSVDLTANGVEQSLLAVLHYGLKFDHQAGSVLYFKKDL